MKYTTDGWNEVKAGNIVIARSYGIGDIRILQGMDRAETLIKINEDCPVFLTNNNFTIDRVPKLFTK